MTTTTDPVHAFRSLTPDQMLDAIESQKDYLSDGRFLALNSYENRVYRIGVEEGPPVVAKFYRPDRWSDEAIIEEHQFTMDLAEAEIPVVAPISNVKGETLHKYGAFRYAIYPCHGGRSPELDDPDHLEQLGRFVGRIHALGATSSYQYRPKIEIQNYIIQPRRFLLDNHFIPDHLLTAYTTLTDDLIKQAEIGFDRAGDVVQLRLHGDLHPSNILWSDDGPHIVDFDDARTGPAIQDLWMFLSGERAYMSAKLADLLEGYTQFFEFNPAELHLVEVLRTLRIIYHASWIASRWEDPAFPIAFPWFNTLQYWESHVLALREQAALMNEPPLVWS
ncbi:MAG: serine/threonine protein kinase [Gammaproteobacteria bacterium]|nr:serine/threonine protein kinase [Gammaproteobacteria bacterium]